MKDHVGKLLSNGITEAQLMWEEVIIATLSQPHFQLGIGNMDYVLGNMIAKYVSSAKFYKITTNAKIYLQKIGIDLKKPVHIKKDVYGSKKNTILEHIIPSSVVKLALVENKSNKDQMIYILRNSGFVVIATRDEDELLKKNKLTNRMPSIWKGFGDRPEKRYEVAGIKISNLSIEHAGQICR